jgi:hypothetical protein
MAAVTGNPFVYGEIVTAGAFADREGERERLRGDLAAGQKVFLISPRRYGKSSLIRDVMRGLAREGVLTVEVTVAASSSYVGFLEAYARALVSADTPTSRLQRWVGDLLKTLRPEVRFEPGSGMAGSHSGFTLSFPAVRTARDTARLAAEVFALPGRIAAARKQRLAVALDEFQAIAAFDGGTVEAALRAAVQDQRMVGYVFAGSEPSLMERMLGPRRPFYKAGPVVRLEKIDPDVFADFIEKRFTAGGLKPEPGLGSAIVELAGNVPFDVQRLAHETLGRCEGGRKKGGRPGNPACNVDEAARRATYRLRRVVAAVDLAATRSSARLWCSKTGASFCRPTYARAIACQPRRASNRRLPRWCDKT